VSGFYIALKSANKAVPAFCRGGFHHSPADYFAVRKVQAYRFPMGLAGVIVKR
jgi:hypothetical protein